MKACVAIPSTWPRRVTPAALLASLETGSRPERSCRTPWARGVTRLPCCASRTQLEQHRCWVGTMVDVNFRELRKAKVALRRTRPPRSSEEDLQGLPTSTRQVAPPVSRTRTRSSVVLGNRGIRNRQPVREDHCGLRRFRVRPRPADARRRVTSRVPDRARRPLLSVAVLNLPMWCFLCRFLAGFIGQGT